MSYKIIFQDELIAYFDKLDPAVDRLIDLALSGSCIRKTCYAFMKSQGSFSCSPKQFLFDKPGLLRLERYTQSPTFKWEHPVDKKAALNHLHNLEKEAAELRKIIEAASPAASNLTYPEPGSNQNYWYICRGTLGELAVNNSYAASANTAIYVHGNVFQSEKLAKDYAASIETLLLLRHQPGTEPAKSGVEQFILDLPTNIDSIRVWRQESQALKATSISPVFSTKAAATTAIQAVGEQRILHMFKTLHHIS